MIQDEEVVNEGVRPQGVQVPQVEQVPIANQGNGVSVVPPNIINGEVSFSCYPSPSHDGSSKYRGRA